MHIPQQVAYIIRKLRESGCEAYVVGGCVRDVLLGKTPKDWDITTSAHPEQVKALFGRTIDTGIQHGTVTVFVGHAGYEVTTYRIDGTYEDGRHPKEVAFTSDLLEDLKRRDFTINAMAYSPQTGIVDAFNGMQDLRERVIRCVGDPMERFSEDALRILRAIRFSAQLGFVVEKRTYEAIAAIAPNITNISKERIQMELTKLLLSDHPEKIKEVFETGISAYVSLSFAKIPYKKLEIPVQLPAVKYVRWAAFLRLGNPEETVAVLKDLKMDNATISKVQTLVAWSGWNIDKLYRDDDGKSYEADAALEITIRRAMSQMSEEVWDALLELNCCCSKVRMLSVRIRERGDCLDVKHLAVKGQDLLYAGVAPGKKMGEILSRMLDEVLTDPTKNSKTYLLKKYVG